MEKDIRVVFPEKWIEFIYETYGKGIALDKLHIYNSWPWGLHICRDLTSNTSHSTILQEYINKKMY